MHNLVSLICKVLHNFRNELFYSVEVQHNSAIAERHFRTKLERNLTSAIKISQHIHTANIAFLATLDGKG